MIKKTRQAPSLIRRGHLMKKKEAAEACEVEETEDMDVMPFDLFGMGGKQDKQILEDRGIILFNSFVSKDTLAKATRRLLVLHFDDEFVDPIQIILNSPGGYTDGGYAFIDMMKFVKNPVHTIAMGEICSMASSIFIAGDKRTMSPNSVCMMHQFYSGFEGTYQELLANRKAEDLEMEKHLKLIVDHSKYRTDAEVRKHVLLDVDHWMTPQDMKKHGLCDVVQKAKPKKVKAKSSKRKR